MANAALDALPHLPRATAEEIELRRRAALQTIAALRPRDPVEAMLAARCVAAHYATMDALRVAAQPNQPVDATLRLRGKAIGLARMIGQTRRDLLQLQTEAQPQQQQQQQQQQQRPSGQGLPASTSDQASRLPAAAPASHQRPHPAATAPSPTPAQQTPAAATRPTQPAPSVQANEHPMHREPAVASHPAPQVSARPNLDGALASTTALLSEHARPPLPDRTIRGIRPSPQPEATPHAP